MTLAETIQTHIQALPLALQRETLDFITHLEQRYGIKAPEISIPSQHATEDFIGRHAGAIREDFPDDIDEADLTTDSTRDGLE